MPLVEVCVEGIDGARVAEAAGADRVELCASLLEGGLTPSLATIELAMAGADIPVFAMIRPRGGDFLYSEQEFACMLADVRTCRRCGVPGVVFGCLTADGEIDEARMIALVEAADGMSTTCHRAFDMARNLDEAMDTLIRCGIDRVLTSGGCETALEGTARLRHLVDRAAGRIKVMACGGLDAGNIAQVRDETGAPELHFAALRTVPSGMTWRNRYIGMGGTQKAREYELTVTDGAAVAATIAAARAK